MPDDGRRKKLSLSYMLSRPEAAALRNQSRRFFMTSWRRIGGCRHVVMMAKLD